jgi:hypothetical protein
MANSPHVTVYGKPECHLCEQAELDVAAVCEPLGVTWSAVSILGDPVLVDRYAEEIPVIMIDGEQHGFFRVDRARLQAALKQRLST